MAKYVKFIRITERGSSAFDGVGFDYVFDVGTLKDGVFAAEHRHVLDVQASGTLKAVWRVTNAELAPIAAALARPHVLELVRENRLGEPSIFKLNTYSAPKNPPVEPPILAGTVQVVPDDTDSVAPPSLSFLLEDISEVRDQINALAKDLWGDRILLLSQERPLLDMYKNANSAEDFRARVQSLGIIVKDLNRITLAKAANIADPKNVGDFILLEGALNSIAAPSEVSTIASTFKQINYLRQGYPTHGDNAEKVLQAHRHFGFPYPILDFSAAWEVVLGKYFNAMKDVRSLLSSAWSRLGSK